MLPSNSEASSYQETITGKRGDSSGTDGAGPSRTTNGNIATTGDSSGKLAPPSGGSISTIAGKNRVAPPSDNEEESE